MTKYMQETPFDAEALNRLTGGRDNVIHDIMALFIMNVSECLGLMEKVCNDIYGEKWFYAVDELKQTSSVMGASEIAKICDIASKSANNNLEERRFVLARIRSNLHKMQVFARNTGY